MLGRRLLRGGLGFRGPVVPDSLWMGPAGQMGSPGRTALRAVVAGNDLLLEPPALPESYRALLAAVRECPGVRALVRDAVAPVLAAKARARSSPPAPPPHC